MFSCRAEGRILMQTRRTGKSSRGDSLYLHSGNRSAVRLRDAVCAVIEPLEQRRLLTVFTVTTNNDNGGVNPAPGGGTGTLRQAIIDVNAGSGGDEIDFNLDSSALTISPAAALP